MGKGNPCQARRIQQQQGQVMVLVAVALLALIGSAALILLAGSVEWQKNQVQELADSAKKFCPLSKALASVPEITLTATLRQ